MSRGRIIVGIAPGVQHLAYCVLSYKENGELPRVPKFGADILKGIRKPRGQTSIGDLQRKVSIHVKVLDMVLERFPPVLVCIGPPAKPEESELYLAAARFVLRTVVLKLTESGLLVELAEWRTKEALMSALRADNWSRVLDGRIEPSPRLRRPAVRSAAAAALAGGLMLQKREGI